MRAPRPYQSYLSNVASHPLARQVLHTSDTVKGELIASLEYYSEVEAAGRDLLHRNGHAEPHKTFPRFQAYLRQARVFFASADGLHYRASPLNYYYCFMNLAKAVVLAHDPTFSDVNLRHGLHAGTTSGSLRRHFLDVKANGVFPAFYKSRFGNSFPANERVRLATLLGYASDVAFEYSQCKLGTSRVLRCKISYAVNSGQCHAILAVKQTTRTAIKTVIDRSTHFEAVALSVDRSRELFQLTAETVGGYRFFETKRTFPQQATHSIPVPAIVAEVVTRLGKHWSQHPFDGEPLFELNAPIARNIAMNEATAIYLAIFYLGSMVRYRPWVLEEMLARKEAWLIERFVKTAPITFLRHARNMIDDGYCAYALR